MKYRALGWILISSLGPAGAPAEDLLAEDMPAEDMEALLTDLGTDCPALVRSEGVLLEEVAAQLEERLRWAEAAPASVAELAETLSRLPARSDLSGEAAVHGLVGDVFLLTDRLAPAMAAYGRAAEAGPVREARCGMSHGGEVYTFEAVETAGAWRSRSWRSRSSTPYLLIRDPATGHVLERILLPAIPVAMTVDGDLRILYESSRTDGRHEVRSVRLAHVRVDDPVRVPEDLLSRLLARKASQRLAHNFVREADENSHADRLSPELTLRRDAVEGLPADLESLEAALRQAFLRDPTQPWHLFWLGQCLWAAGRPGEAVEVWEDLLAGAFSGIPYYEYADMARHFELYRQPEWADAAFREALERRRLLPRAESSYLIERLVNSPTRWPRLERDRWPELDVERAYLWWLRLREISGVSEGDEFRTVLWAGYFKSVGDPHREAAELDYLDRVRRYPWLRPWVVCADYAVWFLLASSTGLLFITAVLLFRTLKRILLGPWSRTRVRRTGPPQAGEAGRRSLRAVWWRRSGIVLLPLLGVSVNLMAFSFVLHSLDALYDQPLVLADVAGDRPSGVDDLGALVEGWLRNESWQPWRTPYELLEPFLETVPDRIRSYFAEESRPRVVLAVLAGGLLVSLLPRVRRGFWRLASVLIPGAAFLRRGQLIRAYLSVWLFVFACGPLLWLVRTRSDHLAVPSPGYFSSQDVHLFADDFTLPQPYDQVLAESFWPLLWVYPFAKPFYGLVALALAMVLWLQSREALRAPLRLAFLASR